jgi:hypothetical protein
MEKEAQPPEFFFLAMAHWQRGEKDEAVHFFQQGVAGATKDPTNQEQRTYWAEAARVLGNRVRRHFIEIPAEPEKG